jgi:hypothetical protein
LSLKGIDQNRIQYRTQIYYLYKHETSYLSYL